MSTAHAMRRRVDSGIRRRLFAAFATLTAVTLTSADISVERRLATQLPQLGHVGLPFSWTFADDTFVVTGGAPSSNSSAPAAQPNISFDVQGLPSWAAFDASTRTFSGAPQGADLGRSSVTVIANDSDGSTARDTFSLIVISAPPPTLKMPLAAQLPHINGLGAQYVLSDGSQHVPLGWSFSLGFDGNSFQLPGWEKVYCAATRGDGTALPSWLTFNPDTFTFDGVAPTSPSPEDAAFTVMMTASNMRGYGGATDSFRLVIGQQALSLAHSLRVVNTTAGTSFRYTIPTTGVLLNGQQAPRDETISVTATINSPFSWLSFDPASASLSGTPPFNLSSSSDANSTLPQPLEIPVLFSDKSNNSMNTTLKIDVFPSIFTAASLPDTDADPGMPFNVSLANFLRPPLKAANVSAMLTYDPAEASGWFAFNETTLFLSGKAPANAVLDKIKVKIDAQSEVSDDYSRQSSATLHVQLSGSLHAAGGDANDDHHQESNGMTDRTRTVLGAALGTVGGFIVLFLLILGCRRWVAEEEHDNEVYIHKNLGSFDTDPSGKSPALSGLYIPHSQLRMSKGLNASQTKFKASPYLEPTSILVAPILATNGKGGDANGNVMWAEGARQDGVLEQVVVGNGDGSPTLNEAVAMSHAAERSERPRPNGLLAALFSAKKARMSDKPELPIITHGPFIHSDSAGLGLTGLGIGDDDDNEHRRDGDMPTEHSVDAASRVAHSRSRHTIQSRKSSWEEGIWHDSDPRAGPPPGPEDLLQRRDDVLASPESGRSVSSSAPSIPQRRGGSNLLFMNKSGLGPMRHRNGHINDSPAFQTSGTFDTSTSSGGLPLSESRQRMYEEARSGLERRVLTVTNGGPSPSRSAADLAADGTSVRRVDTRRPIAIEESKMRNVSHAISSFEGAFEDADEDITSEGIYGHLSSAAGQHSDYFDGMEDEDVLSEELSTAEIVAAGRALTTDTATAALSKHAAALAAHRQSVLSYITDHEGDHAVQGAAIYAPPTTSTAMAAAGTDEPALKTVPTFSLRPEETMRAVGGDVRPIRY